MLSRDQTWSLHSWGPCTQQVLPTHWCKPPNVSWCWVLCTDVRCSPGPDKKCAASAKHWPSCKAAHKQQNWSPSLQPVLACSKGPASLQSGTVWMSEMRPMQSFRLNLTGKGTKKGNILNSFRAIGSRCIADLTVWTTYIGHYLQWKRGIKLLKSFKKFTPWVSSRAVRKYGC